MKDYNFSCQNCDEPFTILEVKEIEGLRQRVNKGETITLCYCKPGDFCHRDIMKSLIENHDYRRHKCAFDRIGDRRNTFYYCHEVRKSTIDVKGDSSAKIVAADRNNIHEA